MSVNKQSKLPAEVKKLETLMVPLYHEYKQLVTPSEVPNEFHLFVFMTMISGLVGDKIWFREGTDMFYPNLWTMLVGESGVTRKTTAMSPAVKILAKVKVTLLANKYSPEGFFKELVEAGGVGFLRNSELGSLLGALRRDYLSGFVDDLCDYYDPPSAKQRKRLANEVKEVDHIALSWLAATTPDSLNKYDANSRIASGFLPRWNVVFGSPTKTFISMRPAQCHGYFDEFVAKLIQLRPPQGQGYEIRFDADAEAEHRIWYERLRPQLNGGQLGYFEVRILEIVKKYAVLLAFLHNQKTVNRGTMSIALKFGDYFFSTATRLLTLEIAENQNDRLLKKILRAIQSRKERGEPASQRNLMRSTSLLVGTLAIGLANLVARGDIVKNTKDDTYDLSVENPKTQEIGKH